MENQAEIDDLTTKVNEIGEGLTTATTTIEEEFAELEKQISEGVPTAQLDLSKLKGAVEGLAPIADKLENVKPVPVNTTGGQAPAKADGTAQEHTTDPAVAQEQAAGPGPGTKAETQEDEARSQV